MNTKPLFATLALTVALVAPAFAQDGMTTKSDADKTKTTADGMTTKTKMSDDGKMKVKGKSNAGDKMKSKTTPRKGEMSTANSMNGGSTVGVMVGGAMMTPDKDIVDNAVGSADHTTLVAGVKAAGWGAMAPAGSTGRWRAVIADTSRQSGGRPCGRHTVMRNGRTRAGG